MFKAGFDQLAGQPLGDFNRLSDRPAFGYQSGHVGACRHVTTLSKRLDPKADYDFIHLGRMNSRPSAK